MNTDDLNRLRDQAANELTTALAQIAAIDEQIKALRVQRRTLQTGISQARGALKFAEVLSTPPPNPSPALERAKAAMGTEPQPSSPPQEPGPLETPAP